VIEIFQNFFLYTLTEKLRVVSIHPLMVIG